MDRYPPAGVERTATIQNADARLTSGPRDRTATGATRLHVYENAVIAETMLREMGFEAFSGAPYRVSVRIPAGQSQRAG